MSRDQQFIYDYSDFVKYDLGSYALGDRSYETKAMEPEISNLDTRFGFAKVGERCEFCRGMLIEVVCQNSGPDFLNADPYSISNPKHMVRRCKTCGWWYYDHWFYSIGYDWWGWIIYKGILRKFNISSIELPLRRLICHLDSKFQDIRSIHPRMFEKVCESIFKEHFLCEVRLTSYSKDQGIDLYAIIGDVQYAVQLKRRSAAISEGVKAIREFLGVMLIQNQPNGIFCTTADHFSKSAIDEVQSLSLSDRGMKLQLLDYNDLFEIFSLRPMENNCYEPWVDLMAKHGL